jgi:hypothetical protein
MWLGGEVAEAEGPPRKGPGGRAGAQGVRRITRVMTQAAQTGRRVKEDTLCVGYVTLTLWCGDVCGGRCGQLVPLHARTHHPSLSQSHPSASLEVPLSHPALPRVQLRGADHRLREQDERGAGRRRSAGPVQAAGHQQQVAAAHVVQAEQAGGLGAAAQAELPPLPGAARRRHAERVGRCAGRASPSMRLHAPPCACMRLHAPPRACTYPARVHSPMAPDGAFSPFTRRKMRWCAQAISAHHACVQQPSAGAWDVCAR